MEWSAPELTESNKNNFLFCFNTKKFNLEIKNVCDLAFYGTKMYHAITWGTDLHVVKEPHETTHIS